MILTDIHWSLLRTAFLRVVSPHYSPPVTGFNAFHSWEAVFLCTDLWRHAQTMAGSQKWPVTCWSSQLIVAALQSTWPCLCQSLQLTAFSHSRSQWRLAVLWFNTHIPILCCGPALPPGSWRRELLPGRNIPGAVAPECFPQMPLSTTSQGVQFSSLE